jgi:hypothetical protein
MGDGMRTAWSVSLLLAGCACGSSGSVGSGDGDHGGCVDEDGDGYGEGECAGPDCNDSSPDAHTEEECAALCAERGDRAPGCPCDAREPEPCWLGPAGAQGVGVCRAGTMACRGGVWSECEGQVLPREETCDGLDQDCDGVVDGTGASRCSSCDPDCEEDCVGVGCGEAFDPEAEGSGVVSTPEGGITLGGDTWVDCSLLWVANSTQGTVSKIDTRTREETGRFATGPDDVPDWHLDPSRTTVNLTGDVVVANRGMHGTAARYDGCECRDVDGDGVVETSTGKEDVRPWADDECFRWSTPIGIGARASGFEYRGELDGVISEWVWVGDYQHNDIHELDAGTGEPTGRVIEDVTPYGLAIARDNVLWTLRRGFVPSIVRVDTTDPDLETESIALPAGESWYGITVDGEGRVWVGGTVARYDPAKDLWETPAVTVTGAGIAVDADDNALVGEIASWPSGGPWKIDADDLEAHTLGGGGDEHGGGHGWAVDFDGVIWAIEFRGSHAFAFDPDTLALDGGYVGLDGAYTYSDMTGFQLANATSPIGRYAHVFEGCEAGGDWLELSWEATVVDGTQIRLRVRTADDLPALGTRAWIEVATVPGTAAPVDLADELDDRDVSSGRLLEVEAILQSVRREDAPILDSIHASFRCGLE